MGNDSLLVWIIVIGIPALALIGTVLVVWLLVLSIRDLVADSRESDRIKQEQEARAAGKHTPP